VIEKIIAKHILVKNDSREYIPKIKLCEPIKISKPNHIAITKGSTTTFTDFDLFSSSSFNHHVT
jgi:hypothetical protein